jgi:hypothetical protein
MAPGVDGLRAIATASIGASTRGVESLFDNSSGPEQVPGNLRRPLAGTDRRGPVPSTTGLFGASGRRLRIGTASGGSAIPNFLRREVGLDHRRADPLERG